MNHITRIRDRRRAPAASPRRLKSLERAIAVLQAFDHTHPRLGLSELSRKIGMSKATLLRILRTLQAHEFVRQREGDHTFVLGPGVIRLGTLALRHSGVLEVGRPHIRRLQAITEETVCLFVLSGTDRLCVDVIPSQHDLRMTVELGATRPLYAGAAGRVLLAFMEEPVARKILLGRRLPRITDSTITDGAHILRELEDVRRKRFAVSRGEMVPGAAAIAAPMFGRDQALVGAVNVLGPQARLTPARIDELVPLVLETAEAISKEFGHSAETQ